MLGAGVSVGGIYRRFPDELALLCAIQDRVLTRFEERVVQRLAEREQSSWALVTRAVLAYLSAGTIR